MKEKLRLARGTEQLARKMLDEIDSGAPANQLQRDREAKKILIYVMLDLLVKNEGGGDKEAQVRYLATVITILDSYLKKELRKKRKNSTE